MTVANKIGIDVMMSLSGPFQLNDRSREKRVVAFGRRNGRATRCATWALRSHLIPVNTHVSRVISRIDSIFIAVPLYCLTLLLTVRDDIRRSGSRVYQIPGLV